MLTRVWLLNVKIMLKFICTPSVRIINHALTRCHRIFNYSAALCGIVWPRPPQTVSIIQTIQAVPFENIVKPIKMDFTVLSTV